MLRISKWRAVRSLVLAACLLAALCGCESSGPGSAKDEPAEQLRQLDVSDEDWRVREAERPRINPPEPEYEDPRWPTTNSQLLAIPEGSRYYNAWSHVWTNCTVAGPVMNVYQAKDSAGMPIFISIGAQYPSPDCVTLVVWADAYDDFAEMINAVDDGGAWLSVTGYLSEYNGGLQFDISDGYVEYTWWTGVS